MLKTRYLIALLVVLLLLLVGLAYLYLIITRPPGRQVVRLPGLSPIRAIYGFGRGPDELLYRPHGVAVDSKNNIYTTDAGNGRVVVFDRNGDFLFKFGRYAEEPRKSKPGEFTCPLGISIDPKTKRIYVADRLRHRVLIFDSKGKFVREIKVMMPVAVLVHQNRLYVTTYGPIYVTDLNGRQLEKWGKRGRQKGEFDFPNGLAVGKEGNVYISDFNNTRIVGLNKKGEVIWITGRPPTNLLDSQRKIGLPAGMAIDEKQNLYVVDAFHFSIKIFNNKGKMLAEVGTGRSGNREGEFYYPAGIAYMGNNTFVVADKFNNRLQILRISLSEAEAAAGKRGLPAQLWQALKPWCPWLVLLLLILVLVVIGVAQARRRREEKEEEAEDRK